VSLLLGVVPRCYQAAHDEELPLADRLAIRLAFSYLLQYSAAGRQPSEVALSAAAVAVTAANGATSADGRRALRRRVKQRRRQQWRHRQQPAGVGDAGLQLWPSRAGGRSGDGSGNTGSKEGHGHAAEDPAAHHQQEH